jgi:hypothetical protein
MAGCPYSGKYSTTRIENFQVGLAPQPLFEFCGAVAGPNRMRMCIDEAGHHHPAAGIQLHFIGIFAAQIGA